MAKIFNSKVKKSKTGEKSSFIENVAGYFRIGAEAGTTITAILIGGAYVFGLMADVFNSRKNKNNKQN